MRVPLDLIQPNPRNPRVFTSEGDLRSLRKSLEESGQLEPAKAYYVSEADNNGLMLQNGFRRWRCLTDMGRATMYLQIVAQPELMLVEYRQARDINVESKAHSHLDDAVRFPLLMKEAKLDAKGLAKALGMTEGEVSKRCTIGKALPEDILEMMSDSLPVFGVDASYRLAQIATLKGPEGRKFVIQLISEMKSENSKVSVRYLQELVQRLKNKAPNEAPVASGKRSQPIMRTDLVGPLTGNVRAFSNRIEANLENLDPALREELYWAMVKLFADKGLTKPEGGV